MTEFPEFPKYEYTFIIEQLLFEQGTMLVKYMPVKETLISVTYNIPIWPGIETSEIKIYVDKWAPHEKWFAQETILSMGSNLLGVKS